MPDDRSARSGADAPNPTDVTIAALAAMAAAIHDFGAMVLSRGPDADADREADMGRLMLQAINVAANQPESLRDIVDRLAADPRDTVTLAALHRVVQAAVAADPVLLAQVERTSTGCVAEIGIRRRGAPIE